MGLTDNIPGLDKLAPVTKLFKIISTVITIATFITMATPNKVDDAFMQKVNEILNVCAGNVFHNANATGEDPKSAALMNDLNEVFGGY